MLSIYDVCTFYIYNFFILTYFTYTFPACTTRMYIYLYIFLFSLHVPVTFNMYVYLCFFSCIVCIYIYICGLLPEINIYYIIIILRSAMTCAFLKLSNKPEHSDAFIIFVIG